VPPLFIGDCFSLYSTLLKLPALVWIKVIRL
jgi:hypothetical protein